VLYHRALELFIVAFSFPPLRLWFVLVHIGLSQTNEPVSTFLGKGSLAWIADRLQMGSKTHLVHLLYWQGRKK
jgi:hypothetical protein